MTNLLEHKIEDNMRFWQKKKCQKYKFCEISKIEVKMI